MPGQKINLNCTRKLLILTYRARSLFGSLFGDAVFLVVVIWQLLAMNDGTTLVWPDLFFCKELSLVVNKQDQRTMKTTIKCFWSSCRFRIKRQILGLLFQSGLKVKVIKIYYILIKVGLLFCILQWKNNSVDFWHRLMTLKVRIVPFLILNSKTTERPKIFLWPFSKTFGLAYSPLNSAACRKVTLVTLLCL